MKPYPSETRTAFVQLRARGTSLGAIATHLSVPKSTLSDWNNQLADEIARLRAIEWEAVEEQFGRSLEQDLRNMAERIRKWEARVDRMNPDNFDIRQVLAFLRETRREYFRRRAVLMAPLERPSRSCAKHPDESGRFSTSSNPQPRNTNHLQPPPPESSGSTNGSATCPHGAALESLTPDLREKPSPNIPSAHKNHNPHPSASLRLGD